MNNKSRYVSLPNHPGIRKDKTSNTYQASKSVSGKRLYANFKTLAEAIYWKNTFNPDVQITESASNQEAIISNNELNGTKQNYILRDVWSLYQKMHFPMLEKSTVEQKLEKMKFFSDLMELPMVQLNPDLIDKLIEQKKLVALTKEKVQRFSFKNELNELRALCNWYKENCDYRFVNPVLKRHKYLGTLKKAEPKNKKMSPEDALSFFENLEPDYRDFALMQFYIAGRVQEVAGIQSSSIDLKNRSLLIKDVVVWDKKKRFVELKRHTKNGDERYSYLNDVLLEIVNRRLKMIPEGCTYLFNDNGQPFSYRKIQYQYNKALKHAGLNGKYASTHIMRHSMATITRMVTGSLEATQAVTGHKDQKLVQHYASLPTTVQTTALKNVESYMNQLASALRSDVVKKP